MNKFFTIDDKKIDKLGEYNIPREWWSRGYEYSFASKYLKEGEIILDAGCGIEHPFKWFAATKVKKVIAIDIDERLKTLQHQPNIKYLCIDFSNISNEVEKVDVIFCISVLEHLTPEQQKETIKQFSKVLKEKGKLILTVDFPILKPEILKELVKPYFIIGKNKYEESNKDVYSSLYKLKCYSMVLTKR